MVMMEKTLARLFDFQRFSGNARLADIIADTKRRYDNSLSDDDLEKVNAAGEFIFPKMREDKPDA